MADIDFDDYGGTPRLSARQIRRIVNIAGAISSLALVAGVGVWGYNLAVRDVTGVPVIRAAEGPMRVAPSNPGGEIADHQGMAVNAIPELRPSNALPDQIILAPAPVELAEEDLPGLASPEALAPAVSAALPIANLAAVLPDPAPVTAAAEAPPEDAVALALAEALTDDADPQEVAATEPETDPPALAKEAPPGAILRSLRPMARPGGGAIAAIQSVSATPAIATPEIDPATLAAGTRLVQLGAFDTVDLARGEWVRLSGRFGDLLSGKSLVIQSAQSGGRTFFRLRAHGFEGEDDARRFCAALLAEDAACIPVAHR